MLRRLVGKGLQCNVTRSLNTGRACSLYSNTVALQKSMLFWNNQPTRQYSASRCPSNSEKCRTKRLPVPDGTHYRRALPSPLINLTSEQGRKLFKEALDDGHMENFLSLVGNFTHQSDVAMCGPGSLAMVLNAVEADPGRVWRGIWRWYSDDMLECCETLENMRAKGVTFSQFACLAECHGLEVVARRFDQTTFEEFLQAVQESATVPGRHLVVSFSRQSLGQTGIGHFSPIAGYHRSSGMVLVLDVARFKYPSYWVPVDMLWRSMEPLDPDTNQPRGYYLLSRSTSAPAGGHGQV